MTEFHPLEELKITRSRQLAPAADGSGLNKLLEISRPADIDAGLEFGGDLAAVGLIGKQVGGDLPGGNLADFVAEEQFVVRGVRHGRGNFDVLFDLLLEVRDLRVGGANQKQALSPPQVA